jgi:hypothetical protein
VSTYFWITLDAPAPGLWLSRDRSIRSEKTDHPHDVKGTGSAVIIDFSIRFFSRPIGIDGRPVSLKEIPGPVFPFASISSKAFSTQLQPDPFCDIILLLARNENGILRFMRKEDTINQ